jgi:hypothetical protein
MPILPQAEGVIVNGGNFVDINNVVADTSEYLPIEHGPH